MDAPISTGDLNHLFKAILIDDTEGALALPLEVCDDLHWVELRVLLVEKTLEDGAVVPPQLLPFLHPVNDKRLQATVESQVMRQVRREHKVRLRALAVDVPRETRHYASRY